MIRIRNCYINIKIVEMKIFKKNRIEINSNSNKNKINMKSNIFQTIIYEHVYQYIRAIISMSFRKFSMTYENDFINVHKFYRLLYSFNF